MVILYIILGICFYIMSIFITRHYVLKGMRKDKLEMTWEVQYVLIPIFNLFIAVMEAFDQHQKNSVNKKHSKFYTWFITRK